MPVKISKISENPINLTEITESVLSAECGADVTFVGRVRNQDSQKQVIKLIYEAHPEASKQIMEISKIISKLFPEVNISTVHRVGELKIGDIAFVVAAASAHRDEVATIYSPDPGI